MDRACTGTTYSISHHCCTGGYGSSQYQPELTHAPVYIDLSTADGNLSSPIYIHRAYVYLPSAEYLYPAFAGL